MTSAAVAFTYAHFIIEELVRNGVRFCCITPGARSSSLNIAAAQNKGLQVLTFVDERSAAYAALGISKSGANPVVIITTSGTAVANLFPAVVEAHQTESPLIILSADRPPELRSTRANQSIDQTKFFGSFVRAFVDLPVPMISLFRSTLSTIDQMFLRSKYPTAGPVHINLMFREPMGIESDLLPQKELPFTIQNWMSHSKVYTQIYHADNDARRVVLPIIESSSKGLVIIASLTEEEREGVLSFVQALGWPVIADAASGLRYRNIKTLVLCHDALIRQSRDEMKPDSIIRFGKIFSSKWIEKLLLPMAHNIICFDNSSENNDPESHAHFRVITHNISQFFPSNTASSPEWINLFKTHNNTVRPLLQKVSIEVKLMTSLHKVLPMGSALFIGNSTPIRDFSQFSSADRPDIRFFCNRGASGIDGLISTAAGVSLEQNCHCTLVLGDLSAIHDLSSLLYLQHLNIQLRIIVINNSGGGIFHLLGVSKSDYFSPVFDAHHDYSLHSIVREMGIQSIQVQTIEALLEFCTTNETSSIQLIELSVDKNKDLENRTLFSQELNELILRQSIK